MKVCFWGNFAGALNGNTHGGGELQLALLAKALAKSGHEVVVIDYETKDDFITSDGIKVLKIKTWNKGLRFIRVLTHRLPQLYLSLKAQKADIYYCRIRDFRHILAFWAARKVNAKFILGIASDLDVLGFLARLKYTYRVNRLNLWLLFSGILAEIAYPWLFKNADLILVQHSGQKEVLLRKSIKSLVFPNLFVPTSKNIKLPQIAKYFIYVGSLDKRKGFHEFYDLVKKAPFHSFIVIGQPRDKVAHKYYQELKSFQNVTLLGRLSHSETLKHIANSKAMISTSPMEGFPNVFIEAWAYGIPVLSLYVDPGEVIKREKLGEIAHGNLDKLMLAINKTKNTNEFTQRAKDYVDNHHALNEDKIKEISSLFYEVLR